MNEASLAKSICRHLDQGAEALPYRVQQRLAAGRTAAVARVPTAPAVSGSAPARRPTAGGDRPAPRRVPLWWRITATGLPAILLVIGMVIGDSVQQEQTVAELAETDSALLTDDIPLVAYADNGFGVYLKNTRR